ncbi:amidohydrolase family protein [Achromobacter sp. Marseille-Q0513]|uniref:metal-dependent hydrolase family protein n=1 Tax=Achromobacter sp. Marseille-Q0513 TaxID=2829161 RepID=UPI001B9FCDCA|nr:amidohydrolase family protein [Achromobacter sp. Marseille-Q0513]MBR8652796.1 amidohydrolase family protein [Achromobacter sp. Marseille-Q0513]
MSTSQQTLFIGGLVFDGLGKTLAGHGVLVQDGRIARVAPAAEFEGYAGRKVDTAGMTLMPSLADCHVHLVYTGGPDPNAQMNKQGPAQITLTALENAQASLRGGVTALRDCGGKDYLEFGVRDAIARGVFPGPAIRASGRIICMTGGHGNRIGRVADGCEEVVKAVREQVHAGCDLVKIMATGGVMTPGVSPMDAHYSFAEMKAGVHEAKRFRKSTASHAQGTEGILNAVRAGIDSIEHGIFMDEECLREMLEAQTYLVPTIAAVRNIVANADNGIPAYAVEKARAVEQRHRESIQMYYKAGGRIAMGTDAGTPFNLHGENAMELAYMVEFGMTPVDALVAGTSRGHDLMGMDGHGAIQDGNAADLLLVQGDPTQDITKAADKRFHVAVLQGGVVQAGALPG